MKSLKRKAAEFETAIALSPDSTTAKYVDQQNGSLDSFYYSRTKIDFILKNNLCSPHKHLYAQE
ncbi:MAG: hypothetical protein JST87_15575 [Bacteroidetes bacterium]|nr:hypothetical protein [Bacteroidota bacterium]